MSLESSLEFDSVGVKLGVWFRSSQACTLISLESSLEFDSKPHQDVVGVELGVWFQASPRCRWSQAWSLIPRLTKTSLTNAGCWRKTLPLKYSWIRRNGRRYQHVLAPTPPLLFFFFFSSSFILTEVILKGLTLRKSVFDVCAGIGLWADLRKGLYRYRSVYTYMRRVWNVHLLMIVWFVLRCTCLWQFDLSWGARAYDSLSCPEVHVLMTVSFVLRCTCLYYDSLICPEVHVLMTVWFVLRCTCLWQFDLSWGARAYDAVLRWPFVIDRTLKSSN